MVAAWAESSVGRVRRRNEDAYLMLPEKSFFLVADGMGGHRRGDLASQICIDSVRDFLSGSARKTIMSFRKMLELDGRAAWEKNICASIEYANRRIYKASLANRELAGMGTTVVSAGFNGTEMFAAWCGDSRLYRFRDGVLTQISEDQSLVNQYLKAGMLTPAQARVFPHRNVILQALGLNDHFQYEWLRETTAPGDMYLMCTDGLNDMITDETIAGILAEFAVRRSAAPEPDSVDEHLLDDVTDRLCSACHALVGAALEAGGLDNVTVMLLSVTPLDSSEP